MAVSCARAKLWRVLRRFGPVVPPILFTAYPLLSLYQQNQTELPLSVIWSPLTVAIAITVALFAVFLLIFKLGTKAGALASLVVVAFFYYGIFQADPSGRAVSDTWLLALWAALCVAAFVALVRTRRTLANLTLGLGVAAAVLTLVPAIRIASYQHSHPSVRITDPRLWPTALPRPASPASTRPDIYVIVPDDYARADVLKRYFRYDNAGFQRQLQRRGFVVSNQVRAPYSDSESNIAAALNMDYLSGLPLILGKKSQDVRPVKQLIEDNRASRLLKSLGYRYVHLDSDEVTFAAGNPHISPVATPDSFTSLWLDKSVLGLVGGKYGFDEGAANERFRKGVRSAFSQLEAVVDDPSPKFVVFHTLLPHDPYVFGAHGERVTFPSDSEDDLGSKLGMKYYLQQLRFLETKLLEAVDAIRDHSKTRPVIVIQADEGFDANPDTVGEAAQLDMRVKGLSALSIPGSRKVGIPQPPNTVNTLRFVFNRYFGTHYRLLRSASYPELDFPYQFKEMHVR
jgi:hypothetical protein